MINSFVLIQVLAVITGVYGLIVLLLAGLNFSRQNNRLQTNARYANRWEVLNLFRTAKQQLKNPQPDAYCLYIGSFDRSILKGIKGFISSVKVFITKKPPSLFVPFANFSIEILGRAGIGKTFLLNLLLASAIEQKLPICLYDFKAGSDGTDGQLPFAAAYGKAHGYQVRIIAPRRKYSNAKINVIEQAIKSKTDMTGARTVAKGQHRALRAKAGRTDGFFGPAGERLLASSFLIAKNTPYPDLATAFAFLTLSNLPQRLEYACQQKNHPVFQTWQQVPLRQLIAVRDAEKTHSGITAQAQDVILDLIQEDLLACFIGQSNTSLYTTSQQMLIFVGDDEREDVIAPFLNSNLYSWVKMNFSDARSDGGVLFLDEVDTLGHFPDLPKQANRYRSKGLSTTIGYQTLSQTNQNYGPEGTKELRTSIGTGIYLNPGDPETALALSNMFGKKEVLYSTTSKTRNGTRGSSTKTEQLREIPLKRPEEFTTSGRSVFTFTNPALAHKHNAFLPLEIKGFKAKPSDIKMQQRYRRLWFDQILPGLELQNQRQKQDLAAELNKRIRYIEELFPLPPQQACPSPQNDRITPTPFNPSPLNNSSNSNSNNHNTSNPELDFLP